MKIIIASDTHKEGDKIARLIDYAKSQGIDTVIDCGDLHGEIQRYKGVNLHAVYWEDASGAMNPIEWHRDVRNIGGTAHENGSTFSLEDIVVFIKHDLAEKESVVPESSLDAAKHALELAGENGQTKLMLFGHTHSFYWSDNDGVIAINPGTLGLGDNENFAVFDSKTKELEYRSLNSDAPVLTIGPDSEYTRIRNVSNYNNKLKFIGRKKNGKEVIVESGVEVSGEYKQIKAELSSIYGKPTFIAINDNDREVLVVGDKEIYEYKKIKKTFTKYDKEGNVVGIEYLIAINDNDREIVVANGKESQEFDEIYDVKQEYLKDGKVVFVANRKVDERTTISQLVVDDDVIVESSTIGEVKIKGDDIAAVTYSGCQMAVFFNGIKTKSYDEINGIEILDEKLAYIAKEGNEMFVVFNGKEGPRYRAEAYGDRISLLTLIGGKIAYTVNQVVDTKSYSEDGKVVVVHDRAESEPYDHTGWNTGVNCLTDAGGVPGYIVKQKNGTDRIIIGGETVAEEKTINIFKFPNGRLCYASKGRLVADGHEVNGYENIDALCEAIDSGRI